MFYVRLRNWKCFVEMRRVYHMCFTRKNLKFQGMYESIPKIETLHGLSTEELEELK